MRTRGESQQDHELLTYLTVILRTPAQPYVQAVISKIYGTALHAVTPNWIMQVHTTNG